MDHIEQRIKKLRVSDSSDDSKLEPIVVDERYEVGRVILDSQASAPFRLVPNTSPVQLTIVEPLILPCYIVHFPFILSLDPDETVNQDVQYIIRGILEISHGDDNLFLNGFTFDKIRTVEVEHFYRDYVDELNRLLCEGTRDIDVFKEDHQSYKPNKKFYFPDETDEYETSVEIANMIDEIVSHDEYSDEMLMVDMSLIANDVQLETISPFDLFGVLAIEMVEDVQLVLTFGLLIDVIHDDDVFEGVINLVVVESEHMHPPLSFDVLSGFVFRVDDVPVQSDSYGLRGHGEDVLHYSDVEVYVDDMIVKSQIEQIIWQLWKDYEKRCVMIKRFDFDIGLGYSETETLHCRVFSALDIPSRSFEIFVDKPALVGRLMRCPLAVSDGKAIDDDFPYENIATMASFSGWRMYFDGAANHFRYGIYVLLISPHGDHILRSFVWGSLINTLPRTILLNLGHWKTKDVKLRPYHAYLELFGWEIDDLRFVLAYCCMIDEAKLDDGLP
ncbi:hypothetical protein CK203_059659 [Vitis vinifera]|uniref:Uncharacterized protein n=1 Tax=Vitis vinifera TaxID=29760 RepID=A0A438H0I6_VITVI|nr:hypothetical protein CK203_059659 [Vitis vinifera]